MPETPALGMLVAVVGPSGAGKDSLIAFARARLTDDPSFMFVRRVVTRAVQGASEEHDTMTADEFRAAEDNGAFAVTWQAHGMSYGIPVSSRIHVRRGGIAVLNGSRQALHSIQNCFGCVTAVSISVDPAVLERRLLARRRETRSEIEARLTRSVDAPLDLPTIAIDNSGDIEASGQNFLQCLRTLRQSATDRHAASPVMTSGL